MRYIRWKDQQRNYDFGGVFLLGSVLPDWHIYSFRHQFVVVFTVFLDGSLQGKWSIVGWRCRGLH